MNIVPIPNPEIAEVTFIQVPTGGVTAPTANPVIRIAPNWIGETPTASQAGRNTGVINKIAGLTSIKVPAIRIMITIEINIIIGWRFIVITNPATFSGIRSRARIQIYSFENAIITMILALVSMAEFRLAGSILVR